MFKTLKMIAAAALVAGAGSIASAASMGVADDYSGTYDIANAFDGHGLYLPGLRPGGVNFDHTWSIQSGSSATYSSADGTLSIDGTVSNRKNSTTYELAFDFDLFEDTRHTGPLICGRTQTACNSANSNQRENIVYFDGDASGKIGTISGLGTLAGLQYDVFINKDGADKLGQLGFGGNWTTLDFGYSNWFTYQRTDSTSISARRSGGGDINLDFLGDDGTPISSTPPVPLPAGLPLLLAGLGVLTLVRRRQSA